MSNALVTGAGRGIGHAIARQLALDGYDIIAVDLDQDSALRTASEFAGRGFGCDVSDRGAVAALAQDVGPINVLVNNAGIWRHGPAIEEAATDVDDVIRVNLVGALNLCQTFTPGMTELGGGSIVNITSVAVILRSPRRGIYAATKGALEVLTQQLAGELAPHGIRVNAVSPGRIVTEGTSKSYEGDASTERASVIPLRRVGRPEDIANAVSFLVSDRASYISGQILGVDGGLTAAFPNA